MWGHQAEIHGRLWSPQPAMQRTVAGEEAVPCRCSGCSPNAGALTLAALPACACAQVNKLDWLVFNVALFCTMFAGVDIGLGVSIGVSIFLALYKTAFPKTAVLGRLPETTVFRRVPSLLPAQKA